MFVCLFTRLLEKFWKNIHEILGVGFGTRNDRLHFWDDLLSDLDAVIFFFILRLFSICKTALLYYCLLGVSAIMPTVLVMSLIS